MAAESTQALLATELVPSGQLVTFTLDGVEFGLDIDRVQEITHRIDVTPVPGSPSFILGVINLRGLIIPVIDSRVRFHLAPQEPTTKTRIIVMRMASGPTGLQVDSVAEVVRLEDHTVRETPPLVAGIRAEYLAGMVTVGTRLITLIHLEKLLDSAELTRRAEFDDLAVTGTFAGGGEGDEELEEDGRPFVTFRLGAESFGIALHEVEEIVELPPVTKVPDAPDYVLGVICLRDQVMPLVDLSEILSIQQAGAERKRDMVVLLSFGTARIGVVVDEIQEILRVQDGQMLPPPQTLSEAEREHLEGILLLPGRMVSLINVLKIITGDDQEKIAAMGQGLGLADTRVQETTPSLELVVFRLGPESYGLRLHEVREIIMVGQITPVPRAPHFVDGVLNLRGEVMPVVDLRTRFGLERVEATSISRILITSIGGVYTGLVVDAVDEVRPVDLHRFGPPPAVTAVGANRYIEKVARLDNGMIFLLELQQLLTDAETEQLQGLQGRRNRTGEP
ncbi:chemotaxis protein CheW [Geothrix limicola]|uniref:Chemotaxis protein CheW n=1 Tax=Geothrix limicola TaxID=2927978 RepID=A0ABQ5QIT5_9BACT|nr:chemotaxis protein CheW [Geothrix limicola]GLH74797.1 chemotaxis protein CheW [Geothrix limicola]